MSALPAGDENRDETAPIEPPTSPSSLAIVKLLVAPVLLVALLICAVIYAVIPMWHGVSTARKNLKRISDDGVRAYSRRYQVPAVSPPIYVPGNNPNGPFTPRIP